MLPLLFSNCKISNPVAQQSGKEDIAYLMFVSPNQYAGKTVEVTVDNVKPFAAEVVKEKVSNRKGSQYGIKLGTRLLKVSYEGKVIYQKKIFVSSQEVKQIILP